MEGVTKVGMCRHFPAGACTPPGIKGTLREQRSQMRRRAMIPLGPRAGALRPALCEPEPEPLMDDEHVGGGPPHKCAAE